MGYSKKLSTAAIKSKKIKETDFGKIVTLRF